MIFAGVADDFSGANDLGGRLASSGFRTYVSTGSGRLALDAEALLLNAGTRLLGPRQARQGSRAAWLALGGGARLCFQKMDSTLRGWPGEEILGMLEATGAPRLAFCAAYPRHGRQTLKNAQFVHGRRLDRTEYFRDPLSPARTWQPLKLFPKGLAAAVSVGRLKEALDSGARILCLDAATEAELLQIARACLKAGIRHFAGSSGLGGALAEALSPGEPEALPALPRKRVVLVGSVSETSFSQLAALRASGLEGPMRVALSSLKSRAELRKGRLRAEQALAGLVKRGLKLAGDPAEAFWFLTGGHTAETFYRRLKLEGNWVLGELMEGVPYCRAPRPGKRPLFCATKPGGFGDKQTLIRVLSHD